MIEQFTQSFTIPTFVWVGLHISLALLGAYHVLLYKRDPRSALSWLAVCILMPFVGPISYFLFGINRLKSRARNLSHSFLVFDYESNHSRAPIHDFTHVGLRHLGSRLNGRELHSGNQVTPLYNGEQAYPAMLAAIASAQQRIELSTYILKTDKTGMAFAHALRDAKKRGVDVRVLIDGVGEFYSLRKISSILKGFKLQTARFLPPKLIPPSIYINLRNHRKLLIVDDKIAYAGGMNIGDGHTSTATKSRAINDLHFQLCGPIVNELSGVFANDWAFATRSKETPRASPAQPEVGDTECRVIVDGPNENLDMLALAIQTSISSASASVDIMTPYFLPSRELIGALQSAALRGVRVRILLPGKNNLPYMQWAHQNILVELLQWGVYVFYQPAPFCHTKLLCIDSEYALIGSANLDPRSLRLNFELGIEVFCSQINSELGAYFDKSINNSKQVCLNDLENRPVLVRLRDSTAALLSPYL